MFIGHKTDGTDLRIPSSSLTTHATVLGSTGSGKSGLILNITDELRKEGIPVILVDIKGDMINIALQESYVRVQCLTPGGTHGEPVDILEGLKDPEKASAVVSGLLSLVGEDSDPLLSRAHMFLTALLEELYSPSLEELIGACQYPPLAYLGALPIDAAFPKATRTALARKLNLLTSKSFDPWTTGEKLDINAIMKQGGVTIYSVSHLINKDEQIFAISLLANEVLQWMKTQSGSADTRLVLGIDECVGLLPPYPLNPATKEPIIRLLKQARAFGVGLILGTQNPVDIDYKALSNCNTWFVGRMTANNDRKKVVVGMSAAGVAGIEQVNTWIAQLKPRQFIVSTHGTLAVFRTKDSSCDLKGPMIPDEVAELYEEGYLRYFPRVRKRIKTPEVVVEAVQKVRNKVTKEQIAVAVAAGVAAAYGAYTIAKEGARFMRGLL